MILIIGGRSKIGRALVGELIARNERVRMLVRRAEGGESLPAEVEAAVGELADPDSLTAAMSRADRVFLLSSAHRDALRWHCNAIDAARAAGVEFLVRSSILGAGGDSTADFVTPHTESDRYLEQSGLEYSILRPNLFMQNIPESTIPAIDGNGNFFANAGDARISMVDTRDVAAVAAVVLTESGHAGAHYDITGPEALSYGDVASKLSAALDRQVTYVNVPDDAVRQTLLGFGMDPWFVGALVGLFADYRRSGQNGYAAAVTDTVRELTGRAPRTLDELLAEQQAGALKPA